MTKIEKMRKIVEENVKGRYPEQCKECGYRNLKVKRGRYVDFYGVPYFWSCDCGWKVEIIEGE